jgi:hypothetical protein
LEEEYFGCPPWFEMKNKKNQQDVVFFIKDVPRPTEEVRNSLAEVFHISSQAAEDFLSWWYYSDGRERFFPKNKKLSRRMTVRFLLNLQTPSHKF